MSKRGSWIDLDCFAAGFNRFVESPKANQGHAHVDVGNREARVERNGSALGCEGLLTLPLPAVEMTKRPIK